MIQDDFIKCYFSYGVFMPLMSLLLTAKVKINNCYSAVYFSVSFFFSRKEHVVNFWLIYIEMVPDYFVFIAQWNLWWMPSHAQLEVEAKVLDEINVSHVSRHSWSIDHLVNMFYLLSTCYE